MFEHPWMTFFVVLALIEAVAAPFRWQKGKRS
jgi:hypothetical protein